MADENEKEKEVSLQEGILNELMAQLQNNPVFDQETIENLNNLISKGELKKATKVMEAIKAKRGI